jgi:hypothetical protein
MTTPTTTSRSFNTLTALGTSLIVAAAVVLLVPLAVPAGNAQAELQGFVLQLLGTVTLLGLAFTALVSAGDEAQRAHAVAPKTTTCAADRASMQPAGTAGAAA